MPQEDKIKREIDRIGLVLAKLLSIMLHKEHPNSGINDIAIQLRSELDIDLDGLLAMSDKQALDMLVIDKKFSTDHLRNFANLLYDLAHKSTDDEQQQMLLKKSLAVYEYIHTNSNGTLFLDVE